MRQRSISGCLLIVESGFMMRHGVISSAETFIIPAVRMAALICHIRKPRLFMRISMPGCL